MRNNNPKLFIILALLFCIISDLWTKIAMTDLLEAGEKLSFAGEIIQVSLVKNHDGFLGIAAPLPDLLRNGLLYGAVSLLLLACLAYLFTSKPSRVTLPLLFVTGGGLSNLLDRIVHHGGVTDFLSVGFGPFRTGIFNLADVYVLTGSAVLGYYFFCHSPSSHNPSVTG